IQANTEFGYVAFGVNRANGYPEMQFEIIEGQTNPLVDGTGTGDLVFISHKGKDRFRGMKIPESRQVLHVPNIFAGQAVEGEARKGGVVSIKFPKAWEGKPAISDIELLTLMAESDSRQMEFYGMFPDIEGGLIIRRDTKGNIRFFKDPSEPDGIAKDQAGKPRMQVYKFQTQIRPDATYNFKNPDVIEQYWLELPEEEYARALSEGKVLYNVAQAHTQGCASGEVFILDKDKKDTWVEVVGKIMVTLQSDPDMNEAMKWAKAIVAKVGGRNSHTMIVATEYGLIAISGIESIDKFYNGQKVTIDANRGVILEGDDYKLVSAGNDYNVAELGMLPAGFSLGLNINSMELSEKASPFRNKADFYGIGLLRLELLLEVIGAAGEGFFRYDNYHLYTLLEQLGKDTITKEDRNRLSKMLARKQDLVGLNARITGKNNITVEIDGKRKTYTTPLDFYARHVEDAQYPAYNPAIEQDAKMIQAFDKLVQGQYLMGEERYIELMYRGIKSIVEPLIVDPLEIRVLAQQIENKAVRTAALNIFRDYEKTHSEADDASSMDDIIKVTSNLLADNRAELSENDIKVLELMKRQLSKAFYIRTDDRKSDEYEKFLGAMIKNERNPMMGDRGIRLMLENPKITRIQLAAIKKVVDIGCKKNEKGEYVGKGKFRMRIFFPIVYDPGHFKQICTLCDEAGLTADRIDRGIMTETPQSAELRPFLEAGIDFSSTGGNDMTQYLMQVERQNALPYFNSLTERSVQCLRVVATLGNEIRRWNQQYRVPMGLKPVTAGYCGNWPAVDPIGAIILYLLDFDSASITIPSMDRTTNDLYSLLDTIYGHDEMGIIRVPSDKEKVARDLYRLIQDRKKQAGLSLALVEMLPTLKFALDQRHFSIYDQIDPDAKADVRSEYSKTSISDLHLALPFHYRVLEDYDKREKGNLFVKGSIAGYDKEISELSADLEEFWSRDRSQFFVPEGMKREEALAKAHDIEERLAAAVFARRSIEIRQAVEKALTEAGYDITKKEVAKRFYIDTLKNRWRPLADYAHKYGTQLIITTASEAADLIKPKLGGERYELSKEPNPELGNRGLKKALNPDREIFFWDLQAIKELRAEGMDN
ncbi:MAG: putative PEP-binding protein, partial [Candidatus Omnitrophota bacterium]